jgi:hypothetical protein
MANEAFCIIYMSIFTFAKHVSDGFTLQNVAHPCARGMGADNVDIIGRNMSSIKRHPDALGLPRRVR